MDFQYNPNYEKLSDKQLVELILSEPSDEEAAVYLLYVRYSWLLRWVYGRFLKNDRWFEDCLGELFIYLKGSDGTWHGLAGFEWRSTFSYWLKRVAFNKFRDVLPKLIENSGQNISLDDDDSVKPKLHISDGSGSSNYERLLRKVILLEAIGQLEDDHQFVILKHLEGYRSRDIAYMLREKWEKYGVRKYNNKHELVVPTEEYVNSCRQKAKNKLREIMLNQK